MDSLYKDVFLQIGAKIAYYRRVNHLSQKNLADAVHVSPSVISRVERGEYNDNLSLALLFKIAEVMKLDASAFITFTPYEKSLWEAF